MSIINRLEIKNRIKANTFCLIKSLLPNGFVQGKDWVAKNPCRADNNAGSLRVNLTTGMFNDFADSSFKGCDVIDLYRKMYRTSFLEAIDALTKKLGDSSFSAWNQGTYKQLPAKKKSDNTLFIWGKSSNLNHPYLDKKRITLGNARVNVYKELNSIVVPLTYWLANNSSELKVQNLQFIHKTGDKTFHKAMKNMFHIVSDYDCDKSVVIICEGFATGRSIAESCNYCIISAMSCCNMKTVALRIRDLLPNSKIIIAGDNDEAGKLSAEKTIHALDKNNIQIIYPTHGNDFNDMFNTFKSTGRQSLKFHITQQMKIKTYKETLYV